MGVMISTFVLREFGIGFRLKLSVYSAKDVYGKTEKSMLKCNPCYNEFLYGNNCEGYWD